MARKPTAAAPAATQPVPDADGKIWVEMTTGLSGPALCLVNGDRHGFGAAEAQRLVDAGFAIFCEPPAA